MRFFIANWKANKNLTEAMEWFDIFLSFPPASDSVTIIICPPYPLLYPLKERVKNTKNIYLGSQDLSIFESGTYTGEVTAKTLSGLADYAIIGHSERKENFSETDQSNIRKVILANKYKISPLLCIQDENSTIIEDTKFVVYEPPWAISKGFEDSINTKIEQTPEEAVKVRQTLKINENKYFIYGGSVNPNNIKDYSKFPQIDGVLVGGASLDPKVFYQIINLSHP